MNLSAQDARRLHDTLQILLSPLSYDVPAWGDAVLNSLRTLFHADQALFIFPREGDVLFQGSGLDNRVIEALQAPIVDIRPERFQYEDVHLRHVARVARGAWSNTRLNRLSGGVYFQTSYFQEVIRPNGLEHGFGLTIPLSLGEARLCVAHHDSADDPFDEETSFFLLQTLHSGFRAGTDIQLRLEARRATLVATIDTLGQAILLVGETGRILHQTPELQRVLEADPEQYRVLQTLHEFAHDLRALRSRHLAGASRCASSAGERWFGTSSAEYVLRGSFLSEHLAGRGESILIVLDRLTPVLPSTAALRTRFGLTEREAEIARELAAGRSNRDIAERLCISAHTVRHHAEHIFEKLGVHTRKSLALTLLEAGRSLRPTTPHGSRRRT